MLSFPFSPSMGTLRYGTVFILQLIKHLKFNAKAHVCSCTLPASESTLFLKSSLECLFSDLPASHAWGERMVSTVRGSITGSRHWSQNSSLWPQDPLTTSIYIWRHGRSESYPFSPAPYWKAQAHLRFAKACTSNYYTLSPPGSG